MAKNIAIVITTIHTPEKEFLESLPDVDVIIVDDSNGKINLAGYDFDVYDYKRQEKELGRYYKDFEAFHHSSSCKNFGHFIAYKQGYETIITLDYDCNVGMGFLDDHIKALSLKDVVGISSNTGWVNTIHGTGWYPRGYPYECRSDDYKETRHQIKDKRVVINMGLWRNIVDINAIDKVLNEPPKDINLNQDYAAVIGNAAICGMNVAFIRELTPAYLFLPNFKINAWEVSRHDDIWGGYIVKKLIDKKGDLLTFGKPVVFHSRESNQQKVLRHEHYMHVLNNAFCKLVDQSLEDVTQNSYDRMFMDFANNFSDVVFKNEDNIPRNYQKGFSYLSKYILWWSKLFQGH